MKKNSLIIVLTCILALLFFTYGCEDSGCGGTTSSSSGSVSSSSGYGSVPDPTKEGTYTGCSYTEGITHENFSAGEMYYPCEGNGPFPATTLTGGWTNEYEDMSWLANHLVTHGYIIIGMTPNFNLGFNEQWVQAHRAGIEVLKQENTRVGSEIRGKVNLNKLQIMGFSKGGGGALIAANDEGGNIASCQALAPYIDSFIPNLDNIRGATICYGGQGDVLARPRRVELQYDSVSNSVDKVLVIFATTGHLQWFNFGEISYDVGVDPGSNTDWIRTYITSWMKVYLDGNNAYKQHIDGHQTDWFVQYKSNTY